MSINDLGYLNLPFYRYMFWTEYGARVDYPKIKRAGLDGSNIEEIVSTDLQRPSSLAYDAPLDSIYWVDAGSKTIETSKSDGSQHRVVLRDVFRRPSGIAVYQVNHHKPHRKATYL